LGRRLGTAFRRSPFASTEVGEWYFVRDHTIRMNAVSHRARTVARVEKHIARPRTGESLGTDSLVFDRFRPFESALPAFCAKLFLQCTLNVRDRR
jgi:hypothetical protein